MSPLKLALTATAIIAVSIGIAWLIQSATQDTEAQSTTHTQDQNHQDHQDLQPLTGLAYDLKFVESMVAHHQFGMDMTNLATQHAQQSTVKTLAQNLHQSQMQSWQKFDSIWEQLDGTYATEFVHDPHSDAVSPHHHASEEDMNKLQQLSGVEFDNSFLQSMIDHHQQAIQLAQQALDQSQDQRIIQATTDFIPQQQQEVQQMQALLSI